MTCPKSLAENHKKIMETGGTLQKAGACADGSCDAPSAPSLTAGHHQKQIAAQSCADGHCR